MPSVIPGYEYDIFISYRHKDNKGDQWVTEFVKALRTELESTFKEDISIYFDTNPHDGLLETHNVEKSLEGKLKCLVFIPIISQTYCDTQSFAWTYEFCAFNRLAKDDSLGRDIRLSNGNVASRILPIKIHDLDPEDKTALEKEMGGAVRAIEFVFSASGVNRPLIPSDHADKNLNKINYRDQINKVANAVKQIIAAIRNPRQDQPPQEAFPRVGNEDRNRGAKKKRVFTIISLLLLLLGVIFAVYFYGTRTAQEPSKSIAVLPFENLTNDSGLETFCDGINEEILSHLSKLGSLSVTSSTSMKTFKGTKLFVPEIAKKLGVSHILAGSVRKSGSKIRITATLIDAATDKQIWSDDYDYHELKDIFPVQTDVSTRVTEVLKLKLTPQEKESLSKRYTDNIQAYELYRRGRNFWDKRSKESYDSAKVCYLRAIEIDPDYALAYAGLANCFLGLSGTELQLEVAKDYARKALSLDSTLSEAWTTFGLIRTHIEFDWVGGKPILERAIRLNPNNPLSHLYYGNIFIYFFRDKEKGLAEVKKALELDPLSPSTNWALGSRYMTVGEIDLAIKQFQRVLTLSPNYDMAKANLGLCFLRKKLYAPAKAIFRTMANEDSKILLCLADAKEGNSELARKELVEILKVNIMNLNSKMYLTLVYLTLGDTDHAIVLLQRQHEERSLNMLGLISEPTYDPIRNDPRFKVILKKMNLDHY